MGRDKFQTDFKNHMQYKSNLQKIRRKKIPVTEGRGNTLPPIDNASDLKSSDIQSSRRLRSNQSQPPSSAARVKTKTPAREKEFVE